MKTIISDKKTAEVRAAEKICALVNEKPDSVLALAGGRSVTGLYDALLELSRAGRLSFSAVRVFAVTEYLDAAPAFSHKKTIYDDFLSHTDIAPENVYFPEADKTEEFERLIAFCGGIDIAVLGLGENAHFGYNEPATPFASLSHVQKLTDATKRQNACIFGGVDRVPDMAVTMGIKTITSAKEIFVLAFGESKAEAVHKMLYGRNDSVFPAAFLQIPMNVSVYLDEDASSQV